MGNFQTPKNYSGLASVEQVWNSYDPDHPDRVTVASLYKMAADQGWCSPRNALSAASKSTVSALSALPLASAAIFELSDGDIHILSAPPAKREYVLADTVTAGTLNVLAGAGGVSKTMLVMMISAAMAVGCGVGDLQIAHGASMLFLGEEDQAEVRRRLSAICAIGGHDPTAVSKLVKAFPAAGVDLRLTRNSNGTLNASDLVQNVIQLAQQLRQASCEPVRLIVFDHARLVMDGDPNDAAHVTQLTRVLTQIAQVTGAAVLILAHSPKSVHGKDASEMSIADVAGSSAFADNARSGFIMYDMRLDDAKALQISEADRKKYVKLECAKANYGPKGSEWWFERETLDDWQVQVLKPVKLCRPMFQPGQAKQQLRQKILTFLTAKPGRSRRQLRDQAGLNKLLAASEKDVIAAVDVLLEEGQIELRKPSPAECAKYRLPRGRDLLFLAPIQP